MNVPLSQSRDPTKNDPEANYDGQTDDYCGCREADRRCHSGGQVTRWQCQVCAAPVAILQLNCDRIAAGGTIHSSSDQERDSLAKESPAVRNALPMIVGASLGGRPRLRNSLSRDHLRLCNVGAPTEGRPYNVPRDIRIGINRRGEG